MNSNRIGEQGAIAIAVALEANTSRLLILDIGWNKVGKAGATALANALKVNTVLEVLFFGNVVLAEALFCHYGLTAILDQGDVAIADALQVPLSGDVFTLDEFSLSELAERAPSRLEAARTMYLWVQIWILPILLVWQLGKASHGGIVAI